MRSRHGNGDRCDGGRLKRRRGARSALMLAVLVCSPFSARAAENAGKALLRENCGACHAVVTGEKSRLRQAPNLCDTLSTYPDERLDLELAEGVGSRHPTMPQVQFSDEEITAIYYYLHGDPAGTKD